jgi:hypothetical protein
MDLKKILDLAPSQESVQTPVQAHQGYGHMVVRQIGMTADGTPLYAYRDTAPVVAVAPRRAHPWGGYIALGVGAVAAVSMIAIAVTFLAIALTVGMISITICLLILRSVWTQMVGQKKR